MAVCIRILPAHCPRVHVMVQQGADIIDIGGESTRPGADRVPVEEQLGRVIPIIKQLQQELPADVPISIDTTSTIVAGAALEQGAAIINDISAGRGRSRHAQAGR